MQICVKELLTGTHSQGLKTGWASWRYLGKTLDSSGF